MPFLPFDEKRVVSSTGALSLERVPDKLTVIGGGVIGLEMASVWSRLGSEVTVIEFLDQISGANCDKGISKELLKLLKKQGIKFELGRKVTSAKVHDNGVTLETEAAAGGSAKTFDSDVVLVSVGRRAVLPDNSIDLKTTERGRLDVDERFRTNVPSVRAIGDVVEGKMLAHEASAMGECTCGGHTKTTRASCPVLQSPLCRVKRRILSFFLLSCHTCVSLSLTLSHTHTLLRRRR